MNHEHNVTIRKFTQKHELIVGPNDSIQASDYSSLQYNYIVHIFAERVIITTVLCGRHCLTGHVIVNVNQ